MKKIEIKGKEYVQVNERVLEFKLQFPKGRIITDVISHEDGKVVMKTSVYADDNAASLPMATGWAYEIEGSSNVNKTSYLENCETSAVGRAIGFLGIGIDTSIATGEEVQTAIMQQSEVDKEKPKYEKLLRDCGTSFELKEKWLQIPPNIRHHLKEVKDELKASYGQETN